MYFDFIIQRGECPFFSCRCDYPYRKLADLFMFVIIHSGNWSFCCILSDTITQYLGICWPFCDIATIPYLEILSNSLRLSCKEKLTNFFISPIHGACMFTIIQSVNWFLCCILADMVPQYLGIFWTCCNLATIPYLESLSTFIAVIL